MENKVENKMEDKMGKGSHFNTNILIIVVLLLVPLIGYLIKQSKKRKQSSFIICGPINSGKTELFSQLYYGKYSQTLMSTRMNLTEKFIIPGVDPKVASTVSGTEDGTFELIDFPGHPKLQPEFNSLIWNKRDSIKGIIFVVDADAFNSTYKSSTSTSTSTSVGISTATSTVTSTNIHKSTKNIAESYSRNTAKMLLPLLALAERIPSGLDILIATNKTELFTSLPPSSIKNILEKNLLEILKSRKNNLNSVGDNEEEDDDDDELKNSFKNSSESEWLKRGINEVASFGINKEQDSFSFSDLKGYIEVKDGSAKMKNLQNWLEWFKTVTVK